MKITQDENLINLLSGKTSFIIPKKVTLFGETYKTHVFKTLSQGKKSINGSICHKEKIISLKVQPNIERTHLHEVIHWRDKVFGWKMNSTDAEKESLVKLEAEWWTQYLKQIFPIAKLFENYKITPDPNIRKLELRIKKLEHENKELKLKNKELSRTHRTPHKKAKNKRKQHKNTKNPR